MISRLEGTLVRDGEHVIVDCNGVGYEVTCSAYTLAGPPDRMIAAGLRASSSATGVLCGTISE